MVFNCDSHQSLSENRGSQSESNEDPVRAYQKREDLSKPYRSLGEELGFSIYYCKADPQKNRKKIRGDPPFTIVDVTLYGKKNVPNHQPVIYNPQWLAPLTIPGSRNVPHLPPWAAFLSAAEGAKPRVDAHTGLEIVGRSWGKSGNPVEFAVDFNPKCFMVLEYLPTCHPKIFQMWV